MQCPEIRFMNSTLRLAGLALLFFFTINARAWNGTGHMTVAELAWRKMSSCERKAVSQLLRQHPHYAELLNTNVPKNVERDEWVFLRAATWPDMIRPSRGTTPKPEHITSYHRSEWHYVNLPYVAPWDRNVVDAAAHQPKETNIIERLGVLEGVLKSKETAASERAVALSWYLHLMGDLHQPLHAVAWFSPEFPTGDMGGNSVAIKPQSMPVRLHSFWDDLLGTGESYTFIDHVADTIEANPLLEKGKLKELKAHRTYQAWGEESADFAEAFAYLDGRVRHAVYRDSLSAEDVPDLNLSYEANAQSVAQRRVAVAGVRLGQKLKSIF
ncbi:MAG: hypothetical protein JWM68_1298 [Verrucomicrobiales bacterium]|nr:hypothetical protein [Verrucomicrobiales bacterium]